MLSADREAAAAEMQLAVEQCISEWAGHPSYAWAGECGFFADHLFTEASHRGLAIALDSFDNSGDCDSGKAAIPGISYEDLEQYGVLRELNHVWAVFQARHYDAAHPAGVADPSELRCFRIGVADGLKRRQPAVFEHLLATERWWQESAQMLEELIGMAQARETDYQPN